MPVGMLRKVSGKCSYLGKCVEQPYLIHSVTQVRGAPSVGQNCPSVASLPASTIASKGHLGENGASGLSEQRHSPDSRFISKHIHFMLWETNCFLKTAVSICLAFS